MVVAGSLLKEIGELVLSHLSSILEVVSDSPTTQNILDGCDGKTSYYGQKPYSVDCQSVHFLLYPLQREYFVLGFKF